MPEREGVGENPIDGGGATSGTAAAGHAVSAELLWKARAEEAEAKAESLERRVRELEGELASAREAASTAERRAEIDREAGACGAIDAETVAVLAELALGQMDEPDVRGAIEGLKKAKPFLFSRRTGGTGAAAVRTAMSAAIEPEGAGAVLGDLAEEARASGDRRALLAYLRGKRGV